MFRTIVAVAAIALYAFAAPAAASADVTSQSSSEVDHMDSGSTESTGPGRVLVVTGHSPYYKDGVQQFHENGDPIMLANFGWGSTGTGLAPATIVHN